MGVMNEKNTNPIMKQPYSIVNLPYTMFQDFVMKRINSCIFVHCYTLLKDIHPFMCVKGL
jgi:hypothetical protein